jgi:hypothetical protein
MSIVTVAEVKALGRVQGSNQDTLFQDLIDAAESFVEAYCDISLTSETVSENLDGGSYYIYPSRKPLTAVTTLFEEGEEVDSADFGFEEFGIYQGTELPWTAGKQIFATTYIGGYSDVPAGLKLAIRQMALRAYMNFEAKTSSSESDRDTNWQSLWNGNDITAMLEQFSLKSVLD